MTVEESVRVVLDMTILALEMTIVLFQMAEPFIP